MNIFGCFLKAPTEFGFKYPNDLITAIFSEQSEPEKEFNIRTQYQIADVISSGLYKTKPIVRFSHLNMVK